MSKLNSNPHPVKLFVGMLSNEVSLFEELKDRLQDIFGPSNMESPVWQWEHTDYYTKEMGTGLKRKFIFFQKLINPESIVEVKLRTNEVEGKYLTSPFSKGGQMGMCCRRINLDPGYLNSAKVVLVSTKNYSHRIYLGKGIYGEVTLIYKGNTYQPLPYTYPDFRTQEYLELFKKAREMYKEEMKHGIKLPPDYLCV